MSRAAPGLAWAVLAALLAAPLATAPGATNAAPLAAFAFAPAPANRVDPTVFTDASTDPDGGIVAWAWDFGGLGTSTAEHPTHLFTAVGTHVVRLVVTDAAGASATAQQDVPVVNLAPAAGFAWDTVHPDVSDAVAFHDLSADRDGSVVAWAWDFGDGGTSPLQHPVHAYLAGGWHAVTLRATDSEGATAALTQWLFVCAPGVDVDPFVILARFHLGFEACLHVSGALLG